MYQVDFTFGFEFDGHLVYQDLATNDDPELQRISQLTIFRDPEIISFEEEGNADVLVK